MQFQPCVKLTICCGFGADRRWRPLVGGGLRRENWQNWPPIATPRLNSGPVTPVSTAKSKYPRLRPPYRPTLQHIVAIRPAPAEFSPFLLVLLPCYSQPWYKLAQMLTYRPYYFCKLSPILWTSVQKLFPLHKNLPSSNNTARWNIWKIIFEIKEIDVLSFSVRWCNFAFFQHPGF